MNKKCRATITKMLLNSNKGDRAISKGLLELGDNNNNNFKVDRITKFSEILGTSNPSFSRYIKKSGYPSFKHFSYDFNQNDESTNNEPQNTKDSDNSLGEYYKVAKAVSDKVKKGKIYILSSRRGKSIGKLMNERLNDGGYDNKLYHEMTDDMSKFIREIKGNTLFLITLSGHSRIISKALAKIAALPGDKPQIIILTAGKWMNMFENGDFISIGKIKNRDYKIDDWNNYNLCLLDIMTLVILIINNLTLKKKNKN